MICYQLPRITTSNLRDFTDCYEYITECYYSSKLLRVSYDLFTCCYEQLRVNYEYLRVLTIAKNYLNQSSSYIIVRSITSGDRGDYAAQF